MSESHWCQCDACTEARIEEARKYAELEAKLKDAIKTGAEFRAECFELNTQLTELREGIAKHKSLFDRAAVKADADLWARLKEQSDE